MQSIKILIIDDSEDDIILIKRQFKSITESSFSITSSTNWNDGKKKFQQQSFDLLLVDYMLGELTAMEIVSDIRKLDQVIPVIIMTGQGSEKIAAEITRAGADDYLTKNLIGPEVLRISILSAIERSSLKLEKRLLKEKLKQAQKLEAIGTLAGGIAHDFNNMLMGISGYIELYLSTLSGIEWPSDLKHALEICNQMASVIRNLLNFTGRGGSEIVEYSLNSALKDFHEILKHTLPKSISLTFKLPDDEMTCSFKKNDLHQMLLNLALNAMESMPDGGRLKVDLSTFEPDKSFLSRNPDFPPAPSACIEISDTGSGIPAGMIDRIFDPFFTVKALGTHKGTGLGLTLVWQIVKHQGGVIEVVSAPGEGTAFLVYIPVKFVKDGIAHKTLVPKLSVNTARRGSILIVDDEMAIRLLVSSILGNMGYSVYEASDGLTAIDLFRSIDKIEAVILDLSMPNMNGRECLKKMLEIRPETKVLIATGHDSLSLKNELIELGALGILQKPFQIDELVENLDKIISN